MCPNLGHSWGLVRTTDQSMNFQSDNDDTSFDYIQAFLDLIGGSFKHGFHCEKEEIQGPSILTTTALQYVEFVSSSMRDSFSSAQSDYASTSDEESIPVRPIQKRKKAATKAIPVAPINYQLPQEGLQPTISQGSEDSSSINYFILPIVFEEDDWFEDKEEEKDDPPKSIYASSSVSSLSRIHIVTTPLLKLQEVRSR